jgi:hypothetical protein
MLMPLRPIRTVTLERQRLHLISPGYTLNTYSTTSFVINYCPVVMRNAYCTRRGNSPCQARIGCAGGSFRSWNFKYTLIQSTNGLNRQ